MRHETAYCKERPAALEKSENSGNVTINSENVNINSENVNIDSENVNIDLENVNTENQTDTVSYKCDLCYKLFKSKYSKNDHMIACQRIEHPHQCPSCKCVFSCRQAKSRHMKTCDASTVDPFKEPQAHPHPTHQHINNNTTNNTTNNNINNTINNTININVNGLHINDFGCETGELLTNELLDKWYYYNGKGVIQLIRKIHFNDEFPENTNLRQGRNKKRMRIRENGNWSEYSFAEKYASIVQRYTDILHKRLQDPVVRKELGEQELHDRYSALKAIDMRKNPNEYYQMMDSFRVMLEKVEMLLEQQSVDTKSLLHGA